MKRTLTFYGKEIVGGEIRLGPTYYMEAEYQPVAVRLYAGTAPKTTAKINILDDGVSIFDNRTPTQQNATSGRDITEAAVTAAFLEAGQNAEEYAEDFTTAIISPGSWVYCVMEDTGDGVNFTVHLELELLSEEGERLE